MQLLHIADLHFGRLLYGRSLMDDQRHFVRQSLLPALDEYKPDALLIAGDLYDRQIASVDAIHLFDELIDALCERSIPAVIISGNHDSPDRIAVGKSLLARHGIHIITELKDTFTPVEIGNIQIFPLPYFENAQMRDFLGDETLRGAGACMRAAVEKAGLPADTVNLIEDTSRESANELMKMNGLVDVLIPRGGAGLIKSVVENSTVPVIETGSGNCHIYIDEFADIDMAADIVFNAKTSRPSVCNACESVLVHKAVAEEAIVAVAGRLKEKNVEIFGDEIVCSVLDFAKPATEEDWGKEYLDYKISIKTVDNIDEAIAHIAKYSTGHSESIITENYLNAQKFLNEVDSAAVYVNASTRFTDGGEFGFGAEIGISTQKLHARGPLGLNNLTSEKYVVYGSGQIR